MNRIAALALALFALFALAINAIAVSDDWWIIVLTVLAAIVVFVVIGHDVRQLMEQDDDADDEDDADAGAPPVRATVRDGEPARPGLAWTGEAGDERAVVVTTRPVTAEQLIPALGLEAGTGQVSIMVVAPEGLGHRLTPDDERHYAAARQAEGETVDALRRAGVHAAGHVGDHDPGQAIEDALALFPAPRVVVLASGADAAALRSDVDAVALAKRTGASVEFVDLSPGRGSPS